MRLLSFIAVGVFLLSCSPGKSQEKGKPDLSVSDARKIPPIPPKGVSIKLKGKCAVVTWDRIPLDNIVAYKVYRRVGDSPYALVGTVARPPFVDKKAPSGAASYSVTAVNTYDAESAFATPAKKEVER
jgi:hypothetical protein